MATFQVGEKNFVIFLTLDIEHSKILKQNHQHNGAKKIFPGVYFWNDHDMNHKFFTCLRIIPLGKWMDGFTHGSERELMITRLINYPLVI